MQTYVYIIVGFWQLVKWKVCFFVLLLFFFRGDILA